MTMNPQNPQRGTGVRKATSVRPNPAAAPAAAPAASPGSQRPTGRRPGAPAPAGARPALRSVPQPQGSGKVGKYLLLFIIVALIGMVAYGFKPRKAADGTTKPGLFMALLYKYVPALAEKSSDKDAGPITLDATYKQAIDTREKAK